MNRGDYFDEENAGEADSGFLTYLPVILWQRRWFIIIPLLAGLLAALVALLVMPPVYRSSALMLVQSPQLSKDVTGQSGTGLIDRRLASIRQQVTSRPDLVALIEKHGLYNAERRSRSLSSVIEKMRKAISFTPTVAELPGGQADERTVAFQVSFHYSDPAAAQTVTQELMERVLDLDASTTSEQATNTVQFLTDQARGLQQQMAAIQGQISQINAANGSVLANRGVTMIGGNSGSYDVQIAQLQRDNANLISQREVARTSDNRDPVVVAAETQLAAARAVYSENHPDVVVARQRLAEARELAKSNTAKLPLQSIDQQLQFNNTQIAALRAAKGNEVAQVSSQLNAQARAPLVLQQISELEQRLSGLTTQYDGVSARLLAAKAGVRAEDEQMGQRLTVVEPPVVPDKPVSPNKLLIIALGACGGLGLGLVLALAIEILMKPLRNPAAILRITGRLPLGMVPVVKAHGGKSRTSPNWPRRIQQRLQFLQRRPKEEL
jgi:polysaccharide biosynthesis transport protein